MNLIRAIFLVLLPTAALAAGFTGIYGNNKLGDGVAVVEGFVDKFSEECEYSGDRFLVCKASGKSPLAGTTYEITSDYCKSGYNYVCKKGCERPEVPPNMFESFYECDVCEERCANQQKESKCPFTDRRGAAATLIGDKVNLRSTPDITGKIISSLSYGTRVKVLSQEEICSTISGKVGRWVNIDAGDGKTILRGWIFDAYIKYAE